MEAVHGVVWIFSGIAHSSTAWCTIAKFENGSFSKFATRHCMMQVQLEGMDDST